MRRRLVHRRLARISGLAGAHRPWSKAARLVVRVPLFMKRRRCLGRIATFIIASLSATMVEGPIAGFITGVYAVGAISAWYIRCNRADILKETNISIENVGTLAADLRAGLSAVVVNTSFVGQAAIRVMVARRLSERLGTPLADLLERVEDDLRSDHHIRATIEAQTAGARATTGILALLPFVGILFGIGLGADPIHQLLHTTYGACCALVALIMQGVGLMWSMWLANRAIAEIS